MDNLKILKGRIAVYNIQHRLLESRIYYSSQGMKKIMNVFMQMPCAYYIQVRPYGPAEKKVVYRLPVKHDAYLAEEVKAKMVRPPAIYSNPKYV